MENVGGSITGIARVRNKKEGYIPKKLYECVSYRKYGKSRCVCHNVREDLLLKNFKYFLMLLRDNYKDNIKNLKLKEYKLNKRKSLKELKNNLNILESEYKVILSEKIKELSSCNIDKRHFVESTYKSLQDEKYREIQKAKKQIQKLSKEELKIKESKLEQTIDYFNQIIETEAIDKSILNMLIDKIYIYHDKSVKIQLRIDIEKLL